MTRAEWAHAYEMAWKNYYTDEHVATILKRAVATGASAGNTLFLVTWFKGCTQIENVHPLEGGFLRLKFRRDRRSGLPLDPVWRFYPKYWLETVSKQYRWVSMYVRLRKIYLKIKHDPARRQYTDLALTPVSDEDVATLEMFNNTGAQAFVSQQRRLDKLSHGGDHAPSLQPATDAGAPGVQPDAARLAPDAQRRVAH
jgi:hypothetical protein